MTELQRYMKYLGMLCIALIIFASGIMLSGYQPLTIGRGMTLLALAVGAFFSLRYAYRKR